MASFYIHLAVAKRYMDKNDIQYPEELLAGANAPDEAADKDKAHYTGVRNDNSLLTHLRTKVILGEFLKENSLESDYNKGVFLHLITDYLFFNDFFPQAYLENVTYEDFCKDLYYSYSLTNDILKEQYSILLQESKVYSKIINDGTRKNILPMKDLEIFIERVSNISLEEYRLKLLRAKENILPE